MGYFSFITALAMDYGGYYMGRYSTLAHFDIFSVLFASPWVVFVSLTYFYRKKVDKHIFFGNMMFKTCISVPLARSFVSLY